MRELNICIAPNDMRYLRVKSSEEINLSNQTVTDEIRNDKEVIHNTYLLGKLVSEEIHEDIHYYWYELVQSNTTIDKSVDLRKDILRLEEMVVEAQYNIALLQLNESEG